MNQRLIISDDEVQARGGDGDVHRVLANLGPSLVNCRQKATIWPLGMRELMTADSPFFNYMRMEPNMFDENLNRVGRESKE